jgi:hypothetical protein
MILGHREWKMTHREYCLLGLLVDNPFSQGYVHCLSGQQVDNGSIAREDIYYLTKLAAFFTVMFFATNGR